ncbi:MAG: hypothetical protein JWQ71_826 [Pedosphaera sp.]|nr:hypothetical protein [Pedosphaera sp.]
MEKNGLKLADLSQRGRSLVWLILTMAWLTSTTTYAIGNLDAVAIGLTLFNATTTNINGNGVRVAQAEGGVGGNPLAVEVTPGLVGQPMSLFTYYTSSGSTNNFPNNLGADSPHADDVASYFYGTNGVATNVMHVDNYEAGFFYNSVASLTVTNVRVVNQSFNFGSLTIAQQQSVDSDYDDSAAKYNTLFVSGIGNGGPVNAPATSYNGIGVGAYHGGSSTGPTADNGRAKPDIVARADATSYSTPQVSGAAALLMQAGLRGDGGSDITSAADIRTTKALLLNGAVKPADWAHTNASPLDARYGAGVLNVFNSYKQLAGGKHSYIATTSVSVGNPHPPTAAAGNVSSFSGWDFNTNSSSASQDGINHYYFNLTNSASNTTFTVTATLAWNRQMNQTAINDLDLYLYEMSSGNLIAASTSAVDNVEHIFLTKLPAGRYDLQVLKNGGNTGKRVTLTETYALAFEFSALPLNITPAGNTVVITWPIYPTGFVLESTASLNSSVTWSAVNIAVVMTNNQNRVVLNSSTGTQFFRLRRP